MPCETNFIQEIWYFRQIMTGMIRSQKFMMCSIMLTSFEYIFCASRCLFVGMLIAQFLYDVI